MENKILLEVKPKYVGYTRFFTNLLLAFLYNIFIGIILLIFVFPICIEQDSFLPFILYPIIFIFTIIILMFLDKKNYEVTNYTVYADRVEFEQGYINHSYTTIKMKDIKEIHLIQGIFQKKAELGTICFVTAANCSSKASGICFADIQNPMAIYAKVKQIHESAN